MFKTFVLAVVVTASAAVGMAQSQNPPPIVKQNIKKAQPKVKLGPLEELLVKQQAGQLSDFVKNAMGGCKSKQ